MGRHKTISDDEVLRVARAVFREQGHTATTREIAEAAGISEAVLYQRFGSKHDLFFAAMAPGLPDVATLLGPADPPDDAHGYLRATVVRLAEYFGEIIPLAVHVMTHPSFDPAALGRPQSPAPATRLREGLVERLASLARRGSIATPSESATARLLVSLAHDWALGTVLQHGPPTRGTRELTAMVDVIWHGLRTDSGERRG
jgi:AcrR family transcriptional regulator